MAEQTPTSTQVRIPTKDGKEMGGYLALPPSGKGPSIILVQEIFGVNNAMRLKADEFAAAGYVVLAPDLFWRIEPDIQLGYNEEDRKRAFQLLNRFDFPNGLADLAAAAAWLGGADETEGGVALVGFCIGGKLAVVAGAANPEVRAIVSFYGVKLDENLEQIRALRCPLQIHVGDSDSHVPMETVETLQKALAEQENVEIFVYPGAGHGFFNRDREDAYHPDAARLAKSRSLELLMSAFG